MKCLYKKNKKNISISIKLTIEDSFYSRITKNIKNNVKIKINLSLKWQGWKPLLNIHDFYGPEQKKPLCYHGINTT